MTAAAAKRIGMVMVGNLRGIAHGAPLSGVVDLVEGGVDHASASSSVPSTK